MNTACPVNLAESAYDRANTNAEREAIAVALEQMNRVEDTARSILNGHAIVDVRIVHDFDDETGLWVTKKVTCTFNMQSVSDEFVNGVTPALCLGLHRGEPEALFEAQKMIGDAAQAVAFDALNLWSDPFLDLDNLRKAAEQAE